MLASLEIFEVLSPLQSLCLDIALFLSAVAVILFYPRKLLEWRPWFHREGQSYYYQNAAGLMAGCVITESVPRKDYVRFFLKSPVLFGTLPR